MRARAVPIFLRDFNFRSPSGIYMGQHAAGGLPRWHPWGVPEVKEREHGLLEEEHDAVFARRRHDAVSLKESRSGIAREGDRLLT